MPTSPSNVGAGYEGISLAEMLQDCSACGVLTVDAQGEVVALTPLAKSLVSPRGALKESGSIAALPSSIQSLVAEVRDSGRGVAERQITVPSEEGAESCFSATAIPLAGATRGSTVLVLLNDISSARKLEQHLQRLDRLGSIGTLSASMAHEIKNALVPLKTLVGLLLEKNPDAELAGTVRRELDRADAMVGRMLKFAAPAKPLFAEVRLHELLEHCLHLVQHRLEGKQITFTSRFEASPDACSGDAHELEQAFVNLLLNAVEAMGQEGTLTVTTDLVAGDAKLASRKAAKPSRFLRVAISDTGVGIAPEQMASIFESFFTTKPHGTGLGLAVTRRIVEEHNGLIRVKSKPGKGTTFTIFLPAAK